MSIPFFKIVNPGNLIVVIFAVVIQGIVSGWYPGVILSSFKASRVICGSSVKSRSRHRLKRVLLSLQFLVSMALVLCTLIIGKQRAMMQNLHPGFNKDQVLILGDSPRISPAFKQELQQISGVNQVGLTTKMPGQGYMSFENK